MKLVSIPLISALISLVLFPLVMGVRNDLSLKIFETRYILEGLVLLSFAILGVLFQLDAAKSWRLKVSYLVLMAWPGIIIYNSIYAMIKWGDLSFGYTSGIQCLSEIILMGLPPALIWGIVLNRQKIKLRFHFLTMLTLGIGIFGLLLICSDESPLHLIFWHLLSATVLFLIGLFLDKRLG